MSSTNNKSTQVLSLGLVGLPIAHSLSPLIHNYMLKTLGINADYKLFQIEEREVQDFLQQAWNNNIVGLNITKPYKELVARLVPTFSLSDQDSNSKNLSSINTLVRGDKYWVGTSTDALGFDKSLRFIGTNLVELDNVIILGNGGVSTSILEYILLDTKAKCHVFVLRRNKAKDNLGVFKLLGNRVTLLDFDDRVFSQLLDRVSSNSLIIDSTGAAISGYSLQEFSTHLTKFSGYFVDLSYTIKSSMYEHARTLGIFVQDGLPMLIEQARESHKLWWKQKNPPPYEDIYEHVKRNS